jgi:ATP-binding protein involved in chromosome partitioning
MFEKVGVPILGIVENMAVHVCSNCGHVEHIFGADGGKKMAAQYGMDYLGALPLTWPSASRPTAARPPWWPTPTARSPRIYKAVARQVAIKIAAKAKDFSAQVPVDQDFEGDVRGGG